MACATPLACNAEVIKHEVNVPPNILVLGDSIAAGYGLKATVKTDILVRLMQIFFTTSMTLSLKALAAVSL